MAGVSSYMKNVAKSFGYAIGDTFAELNPVATSLAKESKSTVSELYQSIKSFTFNKESIDERSFKNQAKDVVSATWNNFKDDIKSGNWYNKERQNAADLEMAKAFGMDFDFDFDDNWDFDDPTSDSAQLAMDSDNTKQIIGAVDSVGAGIANTVASATVESAGYIVSSNNKATRALYSLNERGFANVTKGIVALNNTIGSFAQIAEPLQAHMQNSAVFYTKTTETLNSMNQSIQQLVKNTTPAPLSNSSKSYSSKRNKFSDIFSSDTGLSIEAYKDMIKENFSEYKDLADMATSALKGMTGGGKNISVMQFATTMFTKAMIPKMFKESMKNFNEELKYAMAGGITKLRNRQGGFIFEMFKEFFLPKDNFRSQIDPSKYNRGAVAWDGTSRKALTEVIPDALMMIYEALTGDSKRYDYNKGKFVSVSSIKKDFNDTRRNYIKSAGGDYREDALKKVNSNEKLNEAQRAQLNKEIENYFYQAFMSNDGYNVNSKKFDKKKYGVSDEAIAILRSIIEEDRKTGKKRHQKFSYDNIAQRDLYGEYIRNQESSGDNAILHTLNGSEAKRARGMGTIDKWGNDNLFYLRGIYSFTGFIADNLKFIAGKSDTLDYTGMNKRRTLKNRATASYSDNVSYNSASGAGEKKKGESRTTAKESASAETFTNEDVEADKRREENIKNAKGQAKTTIDKAKGFFRRMIGGRGEKGELQKMYEKPFNSVALLLDKIGSGLDKLMWGDDENPEKGLFGYLFDKAKKTFGKIFDKLDEKFGIKDLWNRAKDAFMNGDFVQETKQNLRAVGSSIGGTVKKFFRSGNKKVPTAAYGRKVTKSGIVAVSEGELIIPSELNPYYHGATNKASQRRNESNIVNRFYGSFAEGGTVGDDDGPGLGFEFIKSGINTIGSAAKEFADRIFGGRQATKEENAKVKETVGKILEEAGVNKGAMGAGAVIGGGVSLLSGALISPILGVAAGAAIGLASKSETVQKLLFGDEEKDGLIPKKMAEFIKENIPAMGKGAAIGGATGLFMGSPILGAILGSTVGYVATSEKAKTYLFGELDEDGNRKGGVIPKELQDTIKKKAPNISAGMLAGLAIGPFGLAGNLIAGAGLGFITSSEKFHDWMFNEKDGLATIIHDKVVGNIDNLFHNITNNLLGLGKRIAGSAERGIKNFISNRKKGFEEGKGGILNTVIGGSVSLGGKVIKGTVGKVGDAIGFANRRVRNRNLARGYAVYGEVLDENGEVLRDEKGRKVKRNLTAEERLRYRSDRDKSTSANMDRLISKMNTKDELVAFQNELKALKDPDGEFKRARNNAITKAYTGLEGAQIDRKTIRNIGKLISSGKFDKARQIAESITDTNKKENVLNTIAEAESKFGEASTNKNSVAGKLAALKKQGIDLSNPNDIQAYIDRMEEEKKLNDKFKTENQEKAKEEDYKKTIVEIIYDIDKNIAAALGAEPANVPAWMSVKTNTKIEGAKNTVQKLLFSNKEGASSKSEDSDVRYDIVNGKSVKMRRNSQGEWEPDNRDASTNEALEEQEEQRNNFATIAKNTGFLAGIGGLFGKLHDKLFGEKDEKQGFFSKLISSITGEDGLLGSLLSFFTGSKGKIGSLLSKFSLGSVIKTGIGLLLVSKGINGDFNEFFEKLGISGPGDKHTVEDKDGNKHTVQTNKTGEPVMDENGNWIDAETGKPIDSKPGSMKVTGSYATQDFDTKLKWNIARGVLGTNNGSVVDWALKPMTKRNDSTRLLGENNLFQRIAKKGENKLTEMSAKKAAKEAGKKAASEIIADAAGDGFYQDINGKWHRPNGQFASKLEVDSRSTKNVTKRATKKAAKKAAEEAGRKAASEIVAEASEEVSEKATKKAVKAAGKVGKKTAKTAAKSAKKATKAATKSSKAAAKAVDAVTDAGTKSGVLTKILEALKKFGDAVVKAPGLKKFKDTILNGVIPKIGEVVEKAISKGTKLLSKFADVLENIAWPLKIAAVVWDVSEGAQDARNTFQITTKPSAAQRVIAGAIRALKNFIPFIGSLIPDSLFVDIFCEFLAPLLGIDVSKLKSDRAAAEEEAKEAGFDSVTDYLKASKEEGGLGDYTLGEKVGNAVKSGWQNTKQAAKKFGAGVKNFFTGGKKDKKDSGEEGEDSKKISGKTGILGAALGKVKDLFSNKDGEGNPITGIVGSAIDGLKNSFSGLKNLFNKNKNNENYSSMENSLDKVKKLAEKGDLKAILAENPNFKTDSDDVLSPVWNSGFEISKLFLTATSIFNKSFAPVTDSINASKELAKGMQNTSAHSSYSAGDSGLSNSHISQLDTRYKDMKLGSSTVGEKGCGPAVAAMVANSYGANLPMDKAIKMAQKYQDNSGTKSVYFADALGSAGIETRYLSGSNVSDQVLANIANGEQVILMGRNPKNNSKSKSPFGPNNHYVIASGFDRNGNIIIKDPESSYARSYNPRILRSASFGIATNGSAGASTYDTETARKVWGYFTSKGYSPVVTSAIMGNLYGESGMNPASIQNGGKGPAAGIAQWENFNTKSGRWSNLNKHAQSMGYSWSDLDPQLSFIQKELTSDELNKRFSGYYGYGPLNNAGAKPTTYEQWKKSTDLNMATRQFEGAFERASRPHIEKRLEAAKKYFDLYSGSIYTSNYRPGEPGVPVETIGNVENGVVGPDGSYSSSADSSSTESSSSGFTSILSAISTAFGKIGDLFGFGSSDNDSSTTGSYGNSYDMSSGNFVAIDAATGDGSDTQKKLAQKLIDIQGKLAYSMSGPRDPDKGSADCSSTVNWAYKKVTGTDIGSTSDAILKNTNTDIIDLDPNMKESSGGRNSKGPNVDKLMPGDILLYSRPDSSYSAGRPYRVGHVEMYIGNGQKIGHPGSGYGPRINSATTDSSRYIMAKRLKGIDTTSTSTSSTSTKNYSLDKKIDIIKKYNAMGGRANGAYDAQIVNEYRSLDPHEVEVITKYNAMGGRANGAYDAQIVNEYRKLQSAGGSGLGKSMSSLMKAKFASTRVKSNVTPTTVVRKSAGASGVTVATTNMLTNLKNNIASTRTSSSGISTELIERLLASIIKILESISTNTSSVDKIYQVLTAYVQSGGNNAKVLAAAKAAEASSNNIPELDSTIVDLVGTLAELAKG